LYYTSASFTITFEEKSEMSKSTKSTISTVYIIHTMYEIHAKYRYDLSGIVNLAWAVDFDFKFSVIDI